MIEFTTFYVVFSFCFVFPPSAFVSLGLTIPNLFDSWLGSEDVQFVQYQLRRSSLTVIVHSFLPLGYFAGLIVVEGFHKLVELHQSIPWLQLISLGSLLLPMLAIFKAIVWKSNGWQRHPLVSCLSVYANNGLHWTHVASEINSEFRRIEKVTVRTNPVSKTIITNSWIIKIEPYSVFAAHQNHVRLQLDGTEEHSLTVDSQTAQYLSVRVEHVQSRQLLFSIRLNAVDYADMQDRLQGPIDNVRGVAINQDVHARFSKVFLEEVHLNPVYPTQEQMDPCLGCAVNSANVRLVRRCDADSSCTPCFCRPMWCIYCLSKWFSARQDHEHPETWLSSRCPCPTCRSPFCVLDVSLVEHVENI